MKKKFGMFVLVLLMCLLTGCEEKNSGSTEYQVYYVSISGTRLVEESFTPEDGTPKTITEELLNKMGRPTVGSDHVKALPDDVYIQKCVLGPRQISLDFSKEYYEMEPIWEVLARAAYVNTLIQVPKVEQVVITVDGQPLIDGAGDVVGPMTRESFIDTRGAGINSYQYTSLSLYFASPEGTQLVKEMRNVHYSTNTALEKVVVEELIKGPVNTRLQPVIPSNTKILGIQTENGICTINFDAAFNQATEGSTASAETAVYAVVNALCDVCKVKEVRIQVEGSTEVSFRGEMALDEGFSRNAGIIQSVASEEEPLEPSVGGDMFLKDLF